MDKFVITGGRPLKGKIRADGSKNAVLPIIFASLLIDKGETVIRNVPPLRDIYTTIAVLEHIGAKVRYDAANEVITVDASELTNNSAPYDLMRQMRASFLVLGPILARLGRAEVSLPGGCSLGARPVDFHIKAFSALGATVTEKGGYVVAEASPLQGGPIYFDRPSHTGTENVLFGAVFASNRTTIANAACDPEVVDVVQFLNKAGARISGEGTPNIIVEPVKKLKNIEYTVSGDRLVGGTYLIGSAMTGGDVQVTGVDPVSLLLVLHKLTEMGCEIESGQGYIRCIGPKQLRPVQITTFPFPGFPTDLQACIMAAAATSSGTSRIRETVFVDRFSHTMELARLGADISVAGGEAIVHGGTELHGAQVMASDIRAGAGVVLACLAATGKSEVMRVYHVDRGYDSLELKLSSLGADIERKSG
ncbi:MAG: UDP-N-acetylglucosamine 1-carboxyvinyltransferase [Candidatus Zixiibacteriota bacterium]